MITNRTGNLLRDDAQSLVNTVNTVGVMGKGLALQFKRAFPQVFETYQAACRRGEVRPGQVLPVPIDDGRWVLNFPTKRHWRQPSRLEDIETGLDDLVRVLVRLEIHSVAVPPLGCGNGGLDWPVVRSLIVDRLGGLDVDVRLYGLGTPDAEDMPNRTERPELTPPRAWLLAALARYIRTALEAGVTDRPRASLVEVQKVAYLLQSAGLELGLRFVPYRYGPFSNGLNKSLGMWEGHYLVGYGDGTGGARADLRLTEGTAEAAEAIAGGDPRFERAWERLRRTVLGYEYPEGMELLASVHYLATHPEYMTGPPTVAARLARWSPRKGQIFQPEDAVAACDRLAETDLLTMVH